MIRRIIKKWLYGSCPGISGCFPYFGTKLYFPPKSVAFYAACEQGIFEADNTRLLQALTKPNTWLFDVGANIGLMSAPVLHSCPDSRVLAFEPSPNVLPYLQRSISLSPFRDRWTVVSKAVGNRQGKASFALSAPENNLFDGLRSTNRVGMAAEIEVDMTTLDFEWEALGYPSVSVIKCDVEGAETQVLHGARRCVAAERPAILLEWNKVNLKAYGYLPSSLLTIADSLVYGVYSIPYIAPITTEMELSAHMVFMENFLLLPK